MTIPNLLLIVFAVVIAAGAQLLLRHGMAAAALTSKDDGNLILRAASSPFVWAGLVVFGIAALAWMYTLSRVPLSVAYPFNALGLLLIIGSSVVVLGEKVTPLGWIGAFLVAGGLIVVVIAQNQH